MYFPKVLSLSFSISPSIYMRYLRLFEVFNRSGKCPLGDASNQRNICLAFVWAGKCPLGMCLVEEMSVGELSIGDMTVRENFCRGSVRWEISVNRVRPWIFFVYCLFYTPLFISHETIFCLKNKSPNLDRTFYVK